MLKITSESLRSFLFISVLLIPRQFGLFAANCDFRTRLVSKSLFWYMYSILFGCIFSISYPLAIYSMISNRKIPADSKVYIIVETINYAAMYLFAVIIYIRVIFSVTQFTNCNNLAFTTLDQCRALCKDDRSIFYVVPLALYRYLIYTALNAIALTLFSEDLKTVSFFYKFIYFIPDIVMANTMVRIQTVISVQIISCQRVNQAFSECLIMVKKSSRKSQVERHKISYQAKRNFEKITECHTKIYDVTKITSELTANLIILTILKAFVHISSMVNTKTW